MENGSLALQTLRDSVEAVWAGNADGLFDILEAVPRDEIEPLMVVSDLAFARSAHDVLGNESSIDRMVLVARSLDEGALRVIKPLPYLFEKLIRRQYGEAAIIEDVSMEQVILHSVVGAALLRPHDMERLLQDASTPTDGPTT